MKTRIKEVRKTLKLTQAEFGERLHCSRNYIHLMEAGKEPISNKTVVLISEVFGINEDWLRTGEGEMKKPLSREAEIAEIATSIFKGDDSTFRFQLQKAIAELPEDTLEKAYDFVAKLVDNVRANKKDS